MRILDYGSASIDLVFSVDHIALPGETISSKKREVFPGGKGLNQAIALAKAGAEVYFAGTIGSDGSTLEQAFADAGVHTDYLSVSSDTATGNALIQVDKLGQNSIVLFAGANHSQTAEAMERILTQFEPGDILLLQNEINLVPVLIEKAFARGMTIALNPSPFNAALETCDLDKVGIFLLNEIECEQITGKHDQAQMMETIGKRFPNARIVLTLGEKGVLYHDANEDFSQPAFKIDVVDTTAAGDTFTGYFLAAIARGLSTREAVRIAAKAAAVSVCRQGASTSIPGWDEVTQSLVKQ